jgi:hypothetical protein
VPLADPVEEAGRIAWSARQAGIPLRLMGGVAVALRCPSARTAPLARRYGDIDVATHAAHRQSVERLLGSLGYAANAEVNLLFGRERLIFFDPRNRRNLDAFETGHDTLKLDCLLLTKLQIVQTTEKDYRDIAAMLIDHPFGSDDPEAIDTARIATLCAEDWGLWRTVTDVAARVVPMAAHLGPLPGPYALDAQVACLLAGLEAVPKTMRWKTRALIGRRLQWYELPDQGEKTA